MILDNTYTEVEKDLQIIEDLFIETEEDYEKLYRQIDLTADEFLEIKAGRLVPDKIQLENIYNFAYNHNLYLNEISWLESEDEYNQGNVSIKSHGAHIPITGDIILKKAPGSSNDFGDGFYLGEDISQAGMWVANDIDSSLYIFTFDKSDLVEARFNVDVDWMLAVAMCRNKLDDYADNPRIKALREKVDNCDYVYAPIADNNLFDIIDAFINGEITDLQCLYAISATHLGYQIVLKNEKALSHIDLKKHLYLCAVEKSLFNREADIEMNTSMNKAKIAHTKYKDVGKYIDEVLSESMTEALDTKQMKFKNGLRIEADNGDVVRINKREHKYVVSGFDKDNNLFKPRTYNSLDGVKNYILRTYNIELVSMNESIEQSSQVQQSISNGMEAREYKGFALLKWPNQRDVVIIDPITNAWCGMYKSMKEAKGLIDGTMPQLGSILPPGENR